MTTIEITDPGSKAWMAGVAKGIELDTALATPAMAGEDFEKKLAWFWLYAGVGAAEADITTELLEQYVTGAGTRQPQRSQEFALVIDTSKIVDDDDESEDALGEALASVLRRLAVGVQVIGFDDHGAAYASNGDTVVGQWKVHY